MRAGQTDVGPPAPAKGAIVRERRLDRDAARWRRAEPVPHRAAIAAGEGIDRRARARR
jgi:hypothetical protein